MEPEQDLELIRAIDAGDKRAFERFFHRHRPTVARFVSRMTRRPDVVDEVVNDTMVVVWRKAGSFGGRSSVATWIMGIAYRTTLKHLRRASKHVAEELTEDHSPVATEGPDTALDRERDGEQVRSALSRLTPEHRAVVELTFFHEFSYREIARILDCPDNTVKTRMFHARRRLKRLLRREIGIVPTRSDRDAPR